MRVKGVIHFLKDSPLPRTAKPNLRLHCILAPGTQSEQPHVLKAKCLKRRSRPSKPLDLLRKRWKWTTSRKTMSQVNSSFYVKGEVPVTWIKRKQWKRCGSVLFSLLVHICSAPALPLGHGLFIVMVVIRCSFLFRSS